MHDATPDPHFGALPASGDNLARTGLTLCGGEPIALRLLGVHVSAARPQLPEWIARWKPPLVVVLDHAEVWHTIKAATPQTLFVGRIYRDREPDFNLSDIDPLNLGRIYAEQTLPWVERMGTSYDFWQGPNEPAIHSPEAMDRYAQFEAARVRTLAQHGFRAVIGTFAVGNPADMSFWKAFRPAMETAREHGGALALHQYAWPTLDHQAEAYVLRHRQVYGGAPEHNWAGFPPQLRLPLLITECGLDGLIQAPDPRGWQTRYGPDAYLQQLAWLDTELQKDPYVIGAAIFCAGANDTRWGSYDIWPTLAQPLTRLADPLYRWQDQRPPAPEPTNGGSPMLKPEVYDKHDQLQTWDWLVENHGAISFQRADPADGQVYRLVELRESEGPAVLVASVRNPDGAGLEGIDVARYWPDALPLPDRPAPASRWHQRGVYGPTNANGDIGYGLGSGDYYYPPHAGASAIWVFDASAPSDVASGLGMLGGTNHLHLNPTFVLVSGEPEPEPEPEAEPEPGPWQLHQEDKPGLRMLIGKMPQAGIDVTVGDPWGNATTVRSGSKPEHGPGGWEVVAWAAAVFTVRFRDQAFTVDVADDTTSYLTFTYTEPPTEPEPEPQDPWDLVFERLDRILALLEAE